MDDDWKGEHLIRGLKPDPEDRRLDGMRVTTTLWHARRRSKGKATPAAASHTRFFKSIFFQGKKDA